MTRLSHYFSGLASKRLSAVESDFGRSNQHEFNGVNELRALLSTEKRRFRATLMYLTDSSEDVVTSQVELTWYDARENHLTRSEYRLYFPSNPVTAVMAENDLMIVAKKPDQSLLIIIAATQTSAERQVAWLFGISDEPQGRFFVRENLVETPANIEVGFAAQQILQYLGFEPVSPPTDDLDLILKRFGAAFPASTEFSCFARQTAGWDGSDPDEALVTWLQREEQLFRLLERHMVADRLREGFCEDVDAFISYSLSVQNRRKSRAGLALENQVEELLVRRKLRYSRGQVTEHRSRPDFLFPGIEAYRDPAFPSQSLVMLATKTSCKDRWRQVLSEAARIDQKHLLTVEPAISLAQTDEMQGHNVQLVVPAGLHETYTDAQKQWIWSVQDLVDYAGDRQHYSTPH